MRHDDEVAHGVDALVAGNAECGVDGERQLRRVHGKAGRDERHSACRGEDEFGGELTQIAADCYLPGRLPELRDRDAAVELGARCRERLCAERRQRVVEPVERAFQEIDHGHVVAGGGERRRALRPDQAGADHDDAPCPAGDRSADLPECRRVRVDVGGLDARDRWLPVAEAGREHDRVGVDLGLARVDGRSARVEIRLDDQPVEMVDPSLGELLLVGEQPQAAVGQRRFRQRRPIDR